MSLLRRYSNSLHINAVSSILIITLSTFISSCGTAPTQQDEQSPQPDSEPSTAQLPKSATTPPRFPSADLPPPIVTTQIAPPTVDPAKELVQSGRYLDAALLLSDLAYSLPSPDKQDYLLRVTSLLLQGNYIQQAHQILSSIDVQGLSQEYNIKKSILSAELLLAQQNPESASQFLNSVTPYISSATVENQREFYRARIDIFSAQANYVGSAQARAALETLLNDNEEIVENQETLLRDLQNISTEELMSLISQTSDNTLRGWIELAKISMQVKDEQQAKTEVADWQQRYIGHPVNDSVIDTIVSKQPESLGRPTQIALILPLKGRFAPAASAIRDGFLAAYYNENENQFRPKLKIYDEGDDPTSISSIYSQAISDGADFVIGPLSKKAVSNLADSQIVNTGVLTLNYGDLSQNVGERQLPANFFQMSLSPEQEAVHVAEHAWLDGHTNAAAIYPDTLWGSRVYNAFRQRWEELGGSVVSNRTYDTKKSDYGVPIKKLLNLSESGERFRELKRSVRAGKGKLHFEPRRRKDVDFIFMAAFSRQGRLLRPQLKFHRATEIPVYATSHVYSGRLKPEMDRDMNGVKFSDMPWTLKVDSANKALKDQIAKLWPNSSNRYMRLYALGIDAYQILPELNRMRRNRFATYQGETGVLYLDVTNRLQRKLLWAQFERGRPKVLAEF